MRFSRLLLGAFLAFALAACSGSPADPGGGSGGGADYNLAIVAGSGQEVQVTETAAEDLVVRLTRDGAAASGEQVSFNLDFNCGELSTTSATTDANGEASTRWTAGTVAGDCTVTADYADASTDLPLSVAPGPPELGAGVDGGTVKRSSSHPARLAGITFLQDSYDNPVLIDFQATGGWDVYIEDQGGGPEYWIEHGDDGGEGALTGFVDGDLMAQGTVNWSGHDSQAVEICIEMVGLAPESEGSCED